VPLDPGGIDMRVQIAPDGPDELLTPFGRLLRRGGRGVHQLQPEISEEQLLGEARAGPRLLSRLLPALPCLRVRAHVGLPPPVRLFPPRRKPPRGTPYPVPGGAG